MSLKKFLLNAVLLFVITSRADDFILSYWCGPPASDDINKRYAEVAECGFNYAMFPCSGGDNQAILDACKKNKLKYIVYDSRVLQFPPENPAFKTNLDAIVSSYIKHPALGGYLLGDEPAPDAFHTLDAVNQYLLERDPNRLPFINLYPNYVPEWAIGGTYEQYVEKFLTTVKPRLLSFDHYALLTDGTLRPTYFENLEIIRRQGLKYNIPFGFIFQLTPHFSYRDPTESDLRWQVNTALAYGAKALLYFTYWSPGIGAGAAFKERDAIIDHNGQRSPHYEQVKRINAEIKAWAPTLMKLKSTSVYHTGELPGATRELPKDAIAQIKGTGAFIIGTFKHEDSSEWLMIMNRDMRGMADVAVQFGKGIKRLRELSVQSGKLSTVELRDHELPVQLLAGGAKLFKLSR